MEIVGNISFFYDMCSLICLRRFEIEKMLKSLKIPKIVKSAIFHVLLRKNVTNKFSINRCKGQYLDYLSIYEEENGGFRVTFWDNRGLLSKKHVFGRKWQFFFRLAKKLNLQFFCKPLNIEILMPLRNQKKKNEVWRGRFWMQGIGSLHIFHFLYFLGDFNFGSISEYRKKH